MSIDRVKLIVKGSAGPEFAVRCRGGPSTEEQPGSIHKGVIPAGGVAGIDLPMGYFVLPLIGNGAQPADFTKHSSPKVISLTNASGG